MPEKASNSELARLDSEILLAAIVESSHDGIISKDLNGTVTSWNKAAERIFGYRSDEIVGKSIRILIPPERQAEEDVILSKLRLGERIEHYETVRCRKDGVRIEVSISVSPIRNAEGRSIGASKIACDLTAEKRAVVEAEAARAHFRALFEAAPGLYLVMQPSDDFRILTASEAYLRATMTTRKDIVGWKMFDVFPENPDDPCGGVRNLRASLERVKATKTADVMPVQRYPIRRPQESGGGWDDRYWSPVNSPVLGPKGELEFIIHRVEDVTEYVRDKQQKGEWEEGQRTLETRREHMEAEVYLRMHDLKRANERLRQTQEALKAAQKELQQRAKNLEKAVEERTVELREALQELETFSYSIAHDMRAPLRAMQSFSAILQERFQQLSADEINGFLQRIRSAADRLDHLIRDVLDYTKIASGEIPLEPVETEQLIEGIIATYPHLHAADVKIKLEKPLPRVQANGAALTQVFSNLLGNAVKFRRKNEPALVRIRAEPAQPDPPTVRLWVEDEGIGIEPKDQERIFQMFQRLHSSFEGTGMGLTIVKKAVERIGGRLGVDAEPGQGSRFWIELAKANER